jgi:glycosyltransferase involved in cell wall biosynthesis
MLSKGVAAARLGREHGVPSVLTVHSNHDALMEALRRADDLLLSALREATAIIRVNPFDVGELSQAAGGRDDIQYIPNGFDPARIPAKTQEQLRRELALPLDRQVLVSVGAWIPRKDPLILLDALSRLVAARGAERAPLLVMVGEDRMGGRIQARIAAHGLQNHVRMVPVQPPQRVMAYLRAGDVTVLYSRSEGNPTVMFESLGCGRAYVGSDVGGVRAVLTDPRLGLYGPARNTDALVKLLEQALDTDWDEQYIQNHAARYAWDAIAKETFEKVYEPLLAGKPVGAGR